MFKQKERPQDTSALHERLETIEALVPELRSYALSLTQDPGSADRLVEHCTVRAMERLSRGAEKHDLREWLFATMRNVHRSEIRRRHSRPITDTNSRPSRERNPALTEPKISQTELNTFSHAFSRLSPEEQDLLLRIAVEGASYEEVAVSFGLSPRDIRTRLSQIRRKLRESALRDVH